MWNSWHGYGRHYGESWGSTALHLLVIIVVVRIVWSLFSSSNGNGFPWHDWARWIFALAAISRVAIGVFTPIAPYPLAEVMTWYRRHVHWVLLVSGEVTVFTLVHGLSRYLAMLFCAVCGRNIQAITCGGVDALAFYIFQQFFLELHGVVGHWEKQRYLRSHFPNLFAIFVAGVSFFHTQREFSAGWGLALAVSGSVAVVAIGYWIELVERHEGPGRYRYWLGNWLGDGHGAHGHRRHHRSHYYPDDYRRHGYERSPVRPPSSMHSSHGGGGFFSRFGPFGFGRRRMGMPSGGAHRDPTIGLPKMPFGPQTRVPTPPFAHDGSMGPSMRPSRSYSPPRNSFGYEREYL